MICQYCGKECKSIYSLKAHERLCKQNPNKQISGWTIHNHNKNAKHSNRYIKAKEENRIIIISDETRKKLSKGFKNKHHNQETKNKISNTLKQYFENNFDKIPFIKNHSSKQSYPEQYFEKLFINENIPLTYHKQVGRYELDFYNEDLMKYVEIDGDQHYLPYMIEHDKERTEYLKNLGWHGIRIKWSEYKKLSFEDKQRKIKEIKEFLMLPWR